MAKLPERVERVLDRLLKPAVWLLSLLPLALIVFHGLTDRLGAEPIEEITHRTGKTALTLLMVTLAVTPVRRLTGWNGAIRARRALGLFAFFYAVLHFGIYLFDQWFDWSLIVEDVLKRPYVTVGFTALVLLVPLAVTSTKGWIRRLGRGWPKLHRLVYLAAGLAVLHFVWLVKADLRDPLIYAAVFAGLMAFRVFPPKKGKAKKPAPAPLAERDATA